MTTAKAKRKPQASKGGTNGLPATVAEDSSLARRVADMAMGGVVGNVNLVQMYSAGTFGKTGLVDCVESLVSTVKATQSGDLREVEGMLVAQAAALNAIFGELARRSARNMGEYMDAAERYMRLALKAQGQCRATLETLATIKNPPVVFARQANIAHGPQQVNNGTQPAARAEESKKRPSELLEHQHGERLDTGAAGASGRTDPHMAPVGEIHRPANG